MNKIVLTGNVVRDPEVRYTRTGKALCKFTVASDRGGKSAATDFVDIQAWESLAEQAHALKKGGLVRIEGSLQTSVYAASDGSKRRAFVVNAQSLNAVSG